MNRIFLLLLSGLALTACNDDTANVGVDVMPDGDRITPTAQQFQLTTRTVMVDSVLANTSRSQLGCIIDPEMRVKTTSDFLAQFHVPDNFTLPKKGTVALNEQGEVEADSCVLRIYFSDYYGDSLATMKLQVTELDRQHVMEEGRPYYTSIDPADYVNRVNPVTKSVTYAVKDLTVSDEQNSGSKYYRSVSVKLPREYGSELMRKYYENPDDFSNSYKFIHNVCPGFYFKSAGGVGAMLTAQMMCMDLYFRYHSTTTQGNDTIVDGMQRMGATEEVIQNTRIANDYPGSMNADSIARAPYTYLKTPAALFTEATFPVDEMVAGEHYKDSINQVKIVFKRYNTSSHSSYNLPKPTYLLMVRKGEMVDFFENDRLSDDVTSYLTSYSSTNNVYQFSNIARLVTTLRDERDRAAGVLSTDDEATRKAKYAAWEADKEKFDPDWNKVMIIPVNAEYANITTVYGTQKKLMRIQNNLGLSSAKIEGGNGQTVGVSVIYSRYNRGKK